MASSSKKRAKLTHAGTKRRQSLHPNCGVKWFPFPKEHRKRKTARDKVFFFSFLFLSVQSFIVVYYTLKIVTWSIIQITEHHLLKMYRREREETLMTKASMRADGNWFAVDARQLDLERERPWWCQIKTRDRYLITLLLLLGAKFIGGQPRNAKVALSGFSSGIFQVHACCSEHCAVCRA